MLKTKLIDCFKKNSSICYRQNSAIVLISLIILMVLSTALQADDTLLQERLENYRLTPMPASLTKMRNVHPRILLTKGKVTELKTLMKSSHKAVWEETQRQADRAVKDGPPEYKGNGDGVGRWGFEQLWQRNVGNTMGTLAMAWALTEDRKYLDSASAWARASCGYKSWGGLGWADGVDLAASHQLLGLGLIYDWCYDALENETKTLIRETLVGRTRTMVNTTVTDEIWWHRADSATRIWYQWQNAYMQNHLWVNMCGVTVAALAIFDEVDEAEGWIGISLEKISTTMNALGDDGASHEGVGYWDYGVENLLKFMNISRDLLDVDMFDNDWFRNTSKYRMYLSLPVNSWTSRSNAIDIGDCSRSSWYSDYNLRALAKEYADGHAQWLANRVDDGMENSPRNRWLNMLWYEPSVTAKTPGDLPSLHHFSDMDIVSARSGWSGDESMLVFKCGPYLGHKAVRELPYDAASAQHVHPDAGNLIVFGGGEFLLRDDGYSCKWTDQHNTLLIDGQGQTGEGGIFFDGSELHGRKNQPHIVKVTSSPKLDHIIGDATDAYPEALGLKQFTRHILFVKPDVLIVADDIVVDKPRLLELRFHPEQQKTVQNGESFQFHGRNTLFQIDPLTPSGVNVRAEMMTAEHDSGRLAPLNSVRLSKNGRKWRNATALTWSEKGGSPVNIKVREDGDVWTFETGSSTVTLNWVTGEAGIE